MNAGNFLVYKYHGSRAYFLHVNNSDFVRWAARLRVFRSESKARSETEPHSHVPFFLLSFLLILSCALIIASCSTIKAV